MEPSSRAQRRTAHELLPVTRFLGNQQFRKKLQRQHVNLSGTSQIPSRKRNRDDREDTNSPLVVGPDFKLGKYERLVKAEATLRNAKVPKGKQLEEKAKRMRDLEARRHYEGMGGRVQNNFSRYHESLRESVADIELAIANNNFEDGQDGDLDWIDEARLEQGDGTAPTRDNVELLEEMYPGCFVDLDSDYSVERTSMWARLKEEEGQLAQELLSYEARREARSHGDWPAGETQLTLITPEGRIEGKEVGSARTCAEHGIRDNLSLRLDIVARGYIPGSLGRHTVAFSVSLLSFYLKILVYGALARQSWVRALCDHMKVEYTEHSRRLFSDAIELYTRLRDINEKKVDLVIRPPQAPAALSENASEGIAVSPVSVREGMAEDIGAEKCPCCFYKLADEPKQMYDLMFTIDGNFSWKRMAKGGDGHGREYDDAAIRIPANIVDAHEENVRPARRRAQADDEEDGQERCSETKRELTKTIANHIEETGIVTLVCRHGLVWKYLDMTRSGEGAKHAKAMVHWLVANDLAKDTALGYDTGCTLGQSLQKSDLLRSAFEESKMKCVVGSFHGYAHVRKCQVQYHARFVEGMGLEDFEGCEQVYSYTNRFAAMSRNASRYLRRWVLKHVLKHWNAQKYRNQGHLIRSNVKRALKLRNDAITLLAGMRQKQDQHGFGMTDTDLDRYQREEIEYLSSKTGPLQIADRQLEDRLAYMKAVTDLQKHEARLQEIEGWISQSRPRAGPVTDISPRIEAAAPPMSPPQLLRAHGDAQLRISRQRTLIAGIARLVDIENPDDWQLGSSIWQATATQETQMRYRKCLRAVEKECIKRMLEMDKLGFAGTGYRHRKAIMTASKKRNKRLQDLIKECNEMAQSAGRTERLKWEDVVGTVMEERLMAILRAMNESDLAGTAWAHVAIRHAIRAKQQIDRAEEELVRLSLEWRRLRTWVRDREEALRALVKAKKQEHAESGSSDLLGIIMALENRLEGMVLDHKRILFALESCKMLLVEQSPSGMSLEVAERLPDIRHLPEMKHFDTANSNSYPVAGSTFRAALLARSRSFNHRAALATDGAAARLMHDIDAMGGEDEEPEEPEEARGEEEGANQALENCMADED